MMVIKLYVDLKLKGFPVKAHPPLQLEIYT